jgi:hypothetical protein
VTTVLSSRESGSPLCLVCDRPDLSRVAGFDDLPRITSDCRAFPAGGELFVCMGCATVQKRPSAIWIREIGEIYSQYASYYQSGGDEQIVFDAVSGRPRRRSDVLMDRLFASTKLPAKGAALDVGCGNGATLTSMSAVFPAWNLNGYELEGSSRPQLGRIARFEKLYTKSLSAIDREFDLVTMIHSLEHFPSPRGALEDVRNLVGDGYLFIQVCDVEQNPFDILVADHLIHFSQSSLCRLLRAAVISPTSSTTGWVPKEISLLARRRMADGEPYDVAGPSERDVWRRTSGYVEWLRAVMALARDLVGTGKQLGIFGTSIAATWLGSQLEGSVAFFVDEDESRIGKTHMGRPILRPADVPEDSIVYLALAPSVADLIARRLAALQIDFFLPPRLSLAGN